MDFHTMVAAKRHGSWRQAGREVGKETRRQARQYLVELEVGIKVCPA
jgi:hypothetical protein